MSLLRTTGVETPVFRYPILFVSFLGLTLSRSAGLELPGFLTSKMFRSSGKLYSTAGGIHSREGCLMLEGKVESLMYVAEGIKMKERTKDDFVKE